MSKRLKLLSAMLAIGAACVAVQPSAYAQARIVDNANAAGTSTAGAVTMNNQSGQITTESLATAAGADYTMTLTDSKVASANAIVFAWVKNGSNTATGISIGRITNTAGQSVIIVHNGSAGALNGTIIIGFCVLAPG